MSRNGECNRVTNETSVYVKIDLDESKGNKIDTGIGFLDHMLQLFAFHSGFTLIVEAKGDINVDDHHTVEDIGICIGKALYIALGEKEGIERYGTCFLPMDECLDMISIDLSERSYLVFDMEFKRDMVGNFSTEMVEEFFRAVAFNSCMTLHIKCLYGKNDHHKIEGVFKGFGRALKEASRITGDRLNTSKGKF